MNTHHKTAIILFNLGGPDTLDAVRPFLFNLFNDKAIIAIPHPLRWLLAMLISSRRAPLAKEIYEQMGGKSPILEQTQAQAEALEKILGEGYKVLVCMRYWYPRAKDVIEQVKRYAPDRIILLPLYPQFSTTTTASSFAEWEKEARRTDLKTPTQKIYCYPVEENFIAAHVKLLRPVYEQAKKQGAPRVLFSAHGLPEKVIKRGDPYQQQVEQTVAAIVKELDIAELNYVTCYQSRVGPLKWIGPSTTEEIMRAGKDRVAVIVVPVAFVSEHSETLVELDIEYRRLAEESDVSQYHRVPALGTHPKFIEALKLLVMQNA